MYKKPVVITGTVGEDAHVIGTKILSMALREAGFEVIELGCMTPPEEFIKAALDHKADAILMSSLYGMAELDVKDFRKRCDEAGLGDIILYIGGCWQLANRTSRSSRRSSKALDSIGFILQKLSLKKP